MRCGDERSFFIGLGRRWDGRTGVLLGVHVFVYCARCFGEGFRCSDMVAGRVYKLSVMEILNRSIGSLGMDTAKRETPTSYLHTPIRSNS